MSVLKGLRALAAPIACGLILTACQPADETVQPSDAERLAAAEWVHDISDLPPDPAIRYGRLDNGMRYAILRNDTPPGTVAVRMVFNMGSVGEADDQRGLAHFIEHMAFNGSTRVPEGEMVPLLERYGLQFGPDTNAFTGFETVGYQLDLPESDAESVDTALFLMRETASELTLDIDAIDRERGVILSEERVRNTPLRRWNDALRRFRLPNSIVADRDPIGTVEVIETAQRDRFVDFYENFYVPQRAMLVVVGDVDEDVIEQKIRDGFGDWTGPADARSDPDLGTINPSRPFSVGYFNDPEVFTILTVDALRPHTVTIDTAEARFQNNLANLGDAILSRRFQTLVSSGTSPFLQAGANHTTEFDIAERASVLAVTPPDRWEEGLALVEQELRRAIEFGFTQAELDEQLANQHTAILNASDQAGTRENTQLADSIWSGWRGASVLTHPSTALARFEASRSRVTLDAVNEAFRAQWRGIDPLVFLASSVEIENAEDAIKTVWEESQAVAVEAPDDAGALEFAYTDFGPAGSVVEREEIEDLGLVRLRFENGIAVTFKQTEFEDESISVRVDFGRGELEPSPAPAVDLVAGWIFAQSGLGAHSSDELGRVLAGRDVGVGFAVGGDTFRFTSTTTPTDLETQFQIFTAFMTDPGWRSEGLAQFLALAPEFRRNFYATPTGVVQTDVSRMLRSGDPRFGFPDAEEIAGITLETVQAYLTPALEQAPIEITVVGDVSEETVVSIIGSTLGTLPARAEAWPDYEEARILRFPDPVAEPIELQHNGNPQQAMANIYWPTVDYSDRQRARRLALLNAVFDLKLTERLREQEGFTYSAISNDFTSDVYRDYGYLWVGVDVQSADLDATYAAIEELAAEMAAGGITEDEMLRARRPVLEQIEESRESNGWWLGGLSRSYWRDDRLDRLRTVASDYEAIEREELVALAEEYLQSERAWRVSILPRDAE